MGEEGDYSRVGKRREKKREMGDVKTYSVQDEGCY